MQTPTWLERAARFSVIGAAVFLAVVLYGSLSQSWDHSSPVASHAVDQRIEDARLGERVLGRNPLRDQVDQVEPDPQTWRAVSLHMRKPSGKSLWIELLRPLEWIEQNEVDGKISLDLHELGAVGEAEVLAIAPCPEIQPGQGAIVTGKFKHEVDASNRVLHLHIEGETVPIGVTDNHPYWSVDRQDFIAAGELRIGESVDTASGPQRIIAASEVAYSGFLYNLETTEHVFRVGQSGTLVHNNCPKVVFWKDRYYQVHNRVVNALDHVWMRHSFGAPYPNVSRFASQFSTKFKLKGLISEALKEGKVLKTTKGADGGLEILIEMNRVIGKSQAGAATKKIKLFLDAANNVKTAFPF